VSGTDFSSGGIIVKKPVLFLFALACVAHAHANPALYGTWSAASVNGKPLVVTFNANGSGSVNNQAMQWQTLGQGLFIQTNRQVVMYSFEPKGDKLTVSGGDLQGIAVLSKGTAAADAAKAKQASGAAPRTSSATGGNAQELVGRWCNMAQMNANAGGSSRMECFQLNGDGSYTYNYEGSMSGSTGSMASQSADAGRWSYDGTRLSAQSRSGKTSSYALEKRNHPKNRRDPMICLDDKCYVTYYNKPAW